LDISLVLVLKKLLAHQYKIIQQLLRRTLVLRQFYSAIKIFREISQLYLTSGKKLTPGGHAKLSGISVIEKL